MPRHMTGWPYEHEPCEVCGADPQSRIGQVAEFTGSLFVLGLLFALVWLLLAVYG